MRSDTNPDGDPRAALVEAALGLAREEGPDKLTMRAVARRARVSPRTLSRHFANPTTFLTAVAEAAMQRLRAVMEEARAATAERDALARFRALGAAYLRWVRANPNLFLLLAERRRIDFAGSPALLGDNAAIKDWMREVIADAQRTGWHSKADPRLLLLAMRAMAFGLARMAVDGQMPHWDIDDKEVEPAMIAALDLLLVGLAPDHRRERH